MWTCSWPYVLSLAILLAMVTTGFVGWEDLSYAEPQILLDFNVLCVRYNASFVNEMMDAANHSQFHLTDDLACVSIEWSAILWHLFMLGWSVVAFISPCIGIVAVLSLVGL